MNKSRAKRAGETLAGALRESAELTGRTLRQPLQPEPVARRRFWSWAVVLAVLWHVAWFTTVTHRVPPARAYHPPRTQVAYVALPADADRGRSVQENILRVWSPALFALPTSTGFSGGATEERMGIKPPLQVPAGPAFLIARTPSAPARETESRLDRKVQSAFDRLRAAPEVGSDEPVFSPMLPSVPASLSLSFLGGLSTLLAEPSNLPVPAEMPAGVWMAEAEMRVSREGHVQHVFLVQRTPTAELDQHVVKALRVLRFEPLQEALTGRVRVHYALQAPRERAEGEAK